MIRRLSIAVLVFVVCVKVFGAKDYPASQEELAAVTERGRMLFACDEAAWHATDALWATTPKKEAEKEGVKRYIAYKTEEHWNVAFGHLNEARDSFLVVFEAIQGKAPNEYSIRKNDPPVEDTGYLLSAARAIDTALADFKGENRPYNVAVLPSKPDALFVYVFPAQTADDVFPLGGDVRYLVTADGSRIVERRQLHKTILEFKKSNEGAKTVAGFHTHVLSELPEDTDVFYVLRRKPAIAEYVGSSKKHLYVIMTDGTILPQKF
jgi:hypothetical protein